MKPTDFSSRWVSLFYGSRATLGIIGLLLLAHLLTISWEGSAQEMVLHFRSLGVSLTGLKEGKLWVLVTYGLFHVGWLHLAVNLFGIMALGPKIERIIRARGLLRVFALGVLAGGIGQGLVSLIQPQEMLLVGASGGVMALLLWLTTVAGDSPLRRLPLQARMLGWLVLIYEAVLLVVSLLKTDLAGSGTQVSHACHIAGGLIGWWLAHRQFRMPPDLASLQRQREKHEKRRSLS
jgi:membrane associated rhomboid family serine protease